MAESHVARGFALSLSRRYDEAEKEFEDAIRINPNLFDAFYYFARAAFARGDVSRSAGLFRKAADVCREDFQSAMLLALPLRMLGRMEEAREANREGIKRAEHILALNPSDGRALSLLSSRRTCISAPESRHFGDLWGARVGCPVQEPADAVLVWRLLP